MPKTWQQVQEVTKFLKGKKIGGQDAYGYLDPLKAGAVSPSISLAAGQPPTPSIRTTRPGCSTSTR